MTTDFTEETAIEAVRAAFANAPDPRLKQVMESFVTHLHGFVLDVRPTMAEWERAIGFLTEVGAWCSDTRQEFILLSDTLGVSMLVETLNDQSGAGATAGTVLGPFHMTASPPRELGESIDQVQSGEPCIVTGRVVDPSGTPLAGATVDVWQADDHGAYDVQQGLEMAGNLRGLFTTDADGGFWFRTVMPYHYPIPTDGPAGKLVLECGRQKFRPAHIHFIAQAEGHHPVTTHAFVDGGEHLENDVVFAVKKSLVRDFARVADEEQAARFGVPSPFRHVEVELILAPG